MGTYIINNLGYLQIVFDGLNGRGSGGSCHNASISIDLLGANIRNPFRMRVNEKAKVIFKNIGPVKYFRF